MIRISLADRRFIWVVVAIVALFSAVTVIWAQNTTDPQNSVTITVKSPISGIKPIPIAVSKGSMFTITLPSNHTTGYQWRLAKQPKPAILKQVSSTYVEPSGKLLGQGGTEVWTFKAIGPGNPTIVMEYARPWERNTQPAKTQVFSVSVR